MSVRGVGLFATRIDETFRDLLRTSLGSGLNLLLGGLSDDYEDEVGMATGPGTGPGVYSIFYHHPYHYHHCHCPCHCHCH